LIEERAGCSVADIFLKFGEEKFRSSEKQTILELLSHPRCVIATGGGAIMDRETLSAMEEKGLLIWVNADIQTLLNRVKKSNTRPLLQDTNPQATLEKLYEQRKSLYARAHIKIDTSQHKGKKSDDLILKDMLQAIDRYLDSLKTLKNHG